MNTEANSPYVATALNQGVLGGDPIKRSVASSTTSYNGIPFYESSTDYITIPIGSVETTIVTYAVDERMEGWLQGITISIAPIGSAPFLLFAVKTSQSTNSKFNQAPVLTNFVPTPINFRMKINQNQRISLVAKNSGLAPILVAATLTGYTEATRG